MKKLILLSIVFPLFIVSCTKEQDNNVQKQEPSIYAHSIDSKTTLNDDWSVSWNANDALTVFNSASGKFSPNLHFKINGDPTVGLFTKDPEETDKALLSGDGQYDWYVCSPYIASATAPGATKGYTVSRSPVQIGYSSSAHLTNDDIMAGKSYNVPEGTIPTVALHHVCALMKFTIKNDSGEPVAFTGLTLDATAGGSYITGSFTMDWGSGATLPKLDPSQMGSTKSYTSELVIKRNAGTDQEPKLIDMDEDVQPGASIDAYMCVAPFTVQAGKKITITIHTNKGNVVLEKTLPKDVSFLPGSYNTAELSYKKDDDFVFIETFGTTAVATKKVSSYNKSGLTCRNSEEAEAYAYSVTGNASFALTSDINFGDYSDYLSPCAVKLPATSSTAANSAIYIKNITVSPNTTYIFTYNKSKGRVDGADFDTRTVFKWKPSDATTFETVNETAADGTISQEFTTGDITSIDLGVEALDRKPAGTLKYYPALDYFKLSKKQ